jgi:hypothetical protein
LCQQNETIMTTAKNIFDTISQMNAQVSYTNAGVGVTQQNRNYANSVRSEVLSHLTPNTPAHDIVSNNDKFTDKQLWLVAYNLVKTSYANRVAAVTAELNKKAELKSIKRANKAQERNESNHKQAMREVLKAADKKEFEYFVWAKEQGHELYAEASVNEFINL